MLDLNTVPGMTQHLPSSQPAPLQDMQSAYAVEASKRNKARKDDPALLCGFCDEIWLNILKNYCQNLRPFSLANKICRRLANEVSDWQIRYFLSSAEAKTLFKEAPLKALQSIFQAICEAANKGETLQAMRYKDTFQTILQGEILKEKNPLLAQLIRIFLLQKNQRGHLFEAVKLFSSKPLPRLTLDHLARLDLYTPKMPEDITCLTWKIADKLRPLIFKHPLTIFTQAHEPNMKYFMGLNPQKVQDGIIKTYGNGTPQDLREVENLLASRIEAIVETEAVHWAILNGKKDLLTKLLEYHCNPNVRNESNKSTLYVAIKTDQPALINTLLKHGADVRHLPEGDDDINPIHWAISTDRKILFKTLLASGFNPNVPNERGENAWQHAKRADRPAMVKMLDNYTAALQMRDALPGPALPLRLAKSA